MKSYETIAPMVVPRSCNGVASDEEYTLYTVTTFKKHSPEFIHKARERKWIPRDFKVKEGGAQEEKKELDRVSGEEKRVWGETLRLGRTGWSEGVMVWVHVLVLRVFVETVLRYGLPLDFVGALVRVRAIARGQSQMVEHTDMVGRLPQNSQRKHEQAWTRHTPTSQVTHSARTRRAGRRRMTPAWVRICKQRVKARESTRLTFAMSWKWSDDLLYSYPMHSV